MPDPFENFLTAALSPAARPPDARFVARVEARIALDERLAAERQVAVRGLALHVLALVATAGGIVCLTRAPTVTGLFAASPAAALAVTIAAFALLVGLFSPMPGRDRLV